jgi:twitching motility protein PilT
MRTIDSVLNILVQQGGTELWLASDRRPKMFKEDIELPLTIPAMSAEQIRELLDDLWTAHQEELRERGRLSFAYRSAELGTFAVRLVQASESALEVSFRHGAAPHAGHDVARPEPDAYTAIGAAPSGGDSRDARALPAPLNALLARAVARGASDIHLSPRRAPIVRINGVLEALDGEPGFDASSLLGGQAGLEQIRAGASVDRAFDVADMGRVRVNIYASDEGLCAAVRILRREAPTLSDLHLPAQLEQLVELPHGLIVACGPTGSGKSTTLAALVQHALCVRPCLLVTLEDPIEYLIRPKGAPGLVRQREVGTHLRDFATGLRDALREDPDVLLIGEMRDAETISLALTAAETGHLVFASLHSRTAPSAVERIVDTYPPERQRQIRVQLADSLRAVVAQRLIPAADGQGRVPAVELLRGTHGVANLIREGRTAQIVSALQAGGSEGMLVLERHLADLVRAKRIRRETALAVANDTVALTDYLRSAP